MDIKLLDCEKIMFILIHFSKCLNTEDSIECLCSQPPPHLKFEILHLMFMWEVGENKRWYFFDPWNFFIPSKYYIEILLYLFY